MPRRITPIPNPTPARATYHADFRVARLPVSTRPPSRALRESVAAVGVRVPLLIMSTESGYRVVAGERRLAAARLAGHASVPVVVLTSVASDALVTAAAENTARAPRLSTIVAAIPVFVDDSAAARALSIAPRDVPMFRWLSSGYSDSVRWRAYVDDGRIGLPALRWVYANPAGRVGIVTTDDGPISLAYLRAQFVADPDQLAIPGIESARAGTGVDAPSAELAAAAHSFVAELESLIQPVENPDDPEMAVRLILESLHYLNVPPVPIRLIRLRASLRACAYDAALIAAQRAVTSVTITRTP